VGDHAPPTARVACCLAAGLAFAAADAAPPPAFDSAIAADTCARTKYMHIAHTGANLHQLHAGVCVCALDRLTGSDRCMGPGTPHACGVRWPGGRPHDRFLLPTASARWVRQ
jgi:hypothetical protein